MTPFEAVFATEATLQTNTCLYHPGYTTDGAGMARFLLVVPIWLVVALFGLIGNTLAYLVLRKELRPSSTSFLLKTLAVVDNLVLVTFTLDDSLVRVYISTGVFESYYEFFMMAHPFVWPLKWFIKTLSVYTIILVTTERYIAVCKPLQAAVCCTIKKARIAFLAVCIFSLLYNLPKCWQYETGYKFDICTGRNRPIYIKREAFNNGFFWSTVYSVALFIVVLFVVPFLVLTVLNFFLIRMLKSGATCDFKSTCYSDKRLRLKKMITRRIVIIVSVFLILELPVIVMNIVTVAFRDHVPRPVYHLLQISYVISGMNSVVNFYLYFLTGSSFRQTFGIMITGTHCVKRPSRTSHALGNDTDHTPATQVSALPAAVIYVAEESTTSFVQNTPCSQIKLDASFDVI